MPSIEGGDAIAELFIATLFRYREAGKFQLHAFVVMPDHIHVLLTPKTSLEKAVQFIKGGFSYRARKELGSNMEVWPKGFSDHRIRDEEDYYHRASAMRVIDRIRIPALVITAEDDPFVPSQPFRDAKVTGNPHIDLRVCRHGGHCGFVAPSGPGDDGYWAENQIVQFVEDVIERTRRRPTTHD